MSTGVLVLLVVFMADHARASTLLSRPEQLPRPRQQHNRLLIANTLADFATAGLGRLAKQLDFYVAACESEFEVHVVIITLRPDWGDAASVFAPTRNTCMRLMADLPVALSVHTSHLAARHREVFAAKVDTYDFYLSQEDDMLFKPHHLHYFSKWEHALRPAGLLHPGFFMYETPVDHMNHSALLSYVPALTIDDWRANMHLFRWRGHLLIMLHAAYDASYMLTNSQLVRFSTYPSWLGMKDLEWSEFNPPFQGQWLAMHYHRVVPVSHVYHALLHHSSNKYNNRAVKQNKEQGATSDNRHNTGKRVHGVEVGELLTVLRQCAGIPLDTPLQRPTFGPWNLKVEYSSEKVFLWDNASDASRSQHPCRLCLDAGQAAKLEFKNVTTPGKSSFGTNGNVVNSSNASSSGSNGSSGHGSGGNSSEGSSNGYDGVLGVSTAVAQIQLSCTTSLPRQLNYGCGKADPDCALAYWGPVLGQATSLDELRLREAE